MESFLSLPRIFAKSVTGAKNQWSTDTVLMPENLEDTTLVTKPHMLTLCVTISPPAFPFVILLPRPKWQLYKNQIE